MGTGDGRFVSASARANPEKFFIGIDANAKRLEKLSIKITRKPERGGLANAMFVQAAVEDLPAEFDSVASEIHINFPWGSLLGAVANGDAGVLRTLRRLLQAESRLMITIGIDPIRDRAELDRLGIPEIDSGYLNSAFARCYREAGFRICESREIAPSEWCRLETSWARKLAGNYGRRVHRLMFVRAG